MRTPIIDRYAAVLGVIVAHQRDNGGETPTLAEISREAGGLAAGSVTYILERLERDGRIRREGLKQQARRRIIVVSTEPVRCVACGGPLDNQKGAHP